MITYGRFTIETKYPKLFRANLEQEGWQVEPAQKMSKKFGSTEAVIREDIQQFSAHLHYDLELKNPEGLSESTVFAVLNEIEKAEQPKP